ncbi:MAG: hypothetical protein ABJE66_12935 [Deltaproteobacteria bacterium]
MKYCLALIALAGCLETGEPVTSTAADDLSSENGLSLNGLSLNGLSLNGLSLNGTSLNGLSLNGLDLGLATTTFATWFHADPTNSAAQVAYIVKCAKPTGQNLTWKDPATGTTYTWPGELGLAPLWTNRAMTTAEQQVMSACMVAHANKYGVHVPIAVEGRTAAGTVIARAANELTTYSVREAAFFGNTATGEGAFVCLDHTAWLPQYSSPRACALDMAQVGETSPVCPPIVFAGACSSICTADATKTYYTACKWNNKTYLPLVTRLQLSSFYSCGDGVCQISEHCGTGTIASSCKADCGVCP